MKLKDNFVTFGSDENVMMVSADGKDFSGVLKGNGTVGFILSLLKTETSRENIVSSLLGEYEVSREIAEQDTDRVLETLRSINALE
ncbi:MAG: PqqD family protein [Clostridia bacterium]|nr:PqqD family protein [Clostridia bacterium]